MLTGACNSMRFPSHVLFVLFPVSRPFCSFFSRLQVWTSTRTIIRYVTWCNRRGEGGGTLLSHQSGCSELLPHAQVRTDRIPSGAIFGPIYPLFHNPRAADLTKFRNSEFRIPVSAFRPRSTDRSTRRYCSPARRRRGSPTPPTPTQRRRPTSTWRSKPCECASSIHFISN